MTQPPPAGTYSIQVDPARRVVDLTAGEGVELGVRAARLAGAIDAGEAAAGPGSPVAAALGELRSCHDRTVTDDRDRIGSAVSAAGTAISAYEAADHQMARQYGPFPVVAQHPLYPKDLEFPLQAGGFPASAPR
jgi:hypothetical protein